MKKNIVLAFLLLFAGTALAEDVKIPVSHRLTATVPDKAAYLRLLTSGLDVPEQPPSKRMDVIGTDSDIEWLEAQGYTVDVEIRNLARHYASQFKGSASTMAGFRTLSEIISAVDSLIAEYPEVVSSKLNIGTTIEGRPIYAIRISDNPNVDEGEVGVLFTAATHCREVITPQILIYTMQRLAQGYGTDTMLTRLVDDREIWFVPVVNPDGYYFNELTNPGGFGLWRKNRRNNLDGTFGVDINRNYGHQWGIDNVGSSPNTNSEVYRGTNAFSEPENRAIRDFCIAHPTLKIAFNYHSFSNLWLYPWGYVEDYTPDQALFAAIADSVVTFNGYAPGPGWSLYLVNGDADDWMYSELGILAFTPEVGSGSDWFWPNISRIQPLIDENYPANIFAIEVADGPERLLPPLASMWESVSLFGEDSLQLVWSNADTSINAPVSYDVLELSDPEQVTDSFEDGLDNWLLAGPEVVSNPTHSGSSAIYSNTGDNFTSYLQSEQPYTVLPGDTLRFWITHNIEDDLDYAYVEVSTDGAQSFQPIPGSITTTADPNGQNLGHGITGLLTPYTQAFFDLSSFEGQDIYVRFAYRTDSFSHDWGMYIDDVWPVQVFNTVATAATTSDTSVVLGDHPPGSYFFRLLATDVHGQISRSATKGFTFEPLYVAGDINQSGAINASDIIYLVAYVFKSGPAPLPIEASGDVDATGVVNSGDLIYLVNYVFKSGPAPIQP